MGYPIANKVNRGTGFARKLRKGWLGVGHICLCRVVPVGSEPGCGFAWGWDLGSCSKKVKKIVDPVLPF